MHHYKWVLIALLITCSRLALSINNKRKLEEEISDNSISYEDKDAPRSPFLSSLIQHATGPLFLVKGLASIASVLNSVIKIFFIFLMMSIIL